MKETKNIMFVESRDITPAPNFAGKKSSGHTLLSALKDNLDNHFDSEASVIKMFLAPDIDNPSKMVLISLDNGTGIAPALIHKMYVDNYSTKTGANRWTVNRKRRNLGCKGNGIKNVTARIADSVLTVSKIESDYIYAVEYNPGKMEVSQSFKADVYRVEQGTSNTMIETLRNYWLAYMVNGDGQILNHGTMNIFKNINSEVLNTLKTKLNFKPTSFDMSLGASFGETYEKFLNDGDKLFVGTDPKQLEQVFPLNPFTGANLQSSKIFTYPVKVNGIWEDCKVKCTFYVFPDGVQHYRRTSASFAGVYIYRNDRLHLTQKNRPMTTELPDSAIHRLKTEGVDWKSNTIWDAFPGTHSRYSKIRIKLEMISDLDEAFGVNVVKTEMSFTSALDDLSTYIYKQVRAVDPFKGRIISDSATLFQKYTRNHKKHIDSAISKVLAGFNHPDDLKMTKSIIAKFTEELGESVL